MTIENGMVNGAKGTEGPRQVGTSRCPACGIRGRPGGPSLPGCCFGCRRSLPWSAAVLCRFEDGIHDLVRCVWPISGGWLQLVAPGCTYDTLKHDKTRYFEKNLFVNRSDDPKQ